MRKQDEIRIVLGSKRFAGSANVDEQVPVNLEGNRRDFSENDRSITLNVSDIFESERQLCNKFRISGKIVNIFDNSISGKTNYTPFKNNLYYLNPEQSINTNIWQGYPQYDEFSMIRERGISGHLKFVAKSATSYNWSFYVTYAFSSTTAQTMSYTSEDVTSPTNVFNVADGIPYVMKLGKFNGKKIVFFYCATNHNINPGEFVELSTPINGKTVFQIFSTGDSTYGSEKKVFSIFDLAFSALEVFDGNIGNMKRIKTFNNSGETKSKYYIRLHKVLTKNDDTFITKLGFENNPFLAKRKLEYSALTPNNEQRISIKTGTQSYGFSVNKDVDITNLKDNNNKPVTELFFSIINRGYFGWFNKPANNQNKGIDIGWEFNFKNDITDGWWNHNSFDNKDDITLQSYQRGGNTFYFNKFLNVGDVIKGDFCEYNHIEQKEYVLSEIYHKYSFNTNVFFDNSTNDYPSGYLYKPHYNIPIRVFSDYIETLDLENIADIPYYAYFSENQKQFLWRDLYSYGYIDSDGVGLNIPFTNNAHYPFRQINFINFKVNRNTGLVKTEEIVEPTNDDCE